MYAFTCVYILFFRSHTVRYEHIGNGNFDENVQNKSIKTFAKCSFALELVYLDFGRNLIVVLDTLLSCTCNFTPN